MNFGSDAPKVFISYSHDSQEHKERILTLANRLRAEGVDCNIDQYEESPAEGWPRWMMNQLEWADLVVVVCTEQYDRRFRGREEPGIGRGVTWEGAIISQELYDSHVKSTKFVPVVFSSKDGNFIPIMVRGFSRYDLYTEEGYQAFYRRLTNQPLNPKPPLGEKVELAPRVLPPLPVRDRKQTFSKTRSFFAYDEAWVGRERLIKELSDRVQASCRLLIFVGIAGIGKTALAERLAVELQDWFDGDWSRFHQENFDNDEQAADFSSVAVRWLEKWGELITPDDRKDTQRLLNRLVKYLSENCYLVQMDSLEKILQGNEEEGWSDFKDEWWVKFFNAFLKIESCLSCIILTSQDLPKQIEEAGTRCRNFWHSQLLSGLDMSERLDLFAKTGLDVSRAAIGRQYLERIGAAYEGHPLALRIVAGEIKNKPFDGNVLAYWNKYANEVEEVEKAIAEAQERKISSEDNWKLDRFTRALRRNVRSRLEKAFIRLKEEAKYAYILLCEASVYRCPVSEEFWLSHLEYWDRNEDEQIVALDTLRDRYLVEELTDNTNQCLLRQHNLVRSVSLDHLKMLDEP
ncbi:TIR and AAA domain-containing protein [Calothrix membranacea FACHB-236]|nr:TIR and AAA domain-containing protein [Calothrix membranacea FACHB-236]